MSAGSFFSRFSGGLSDFGQALADPVAFEQRQAQNTLLQQQAQQQAQEAQQAQESQQEFANILSGQSIPQFARAGGAEPATPEALRQTQLLQLGSLAPKNQQASELLGKISPLTQKPIAPQERKIIKDVEGFQRFTDTGERAFPEAKKDISKQRFEEKKFSLQEKKFDQEIKQFERKLKTGGLSQEDVFKRGTKLRGEFTNLSKDFIKQRDAFGRIEASASNPSAAGDLALIFNFMKVLDPGSTVREGEFATAANSAGISDRLRAQYNKVSTGERLADAQRNDFVSRGNQLFKKANRQHNKRAKQFTSLAERLGVDPQDVVLDLGLAGDLQDKEDLTQISTEELLQRLNAGAQ